MLVMLPYSPSVVVLEFTPKPVFWVAVTELILSYYNLETVLTAICTHYIWYLNSSSLTATQFFIVF